MLHLHVTPPKLVRLLCFAINNAWIKNYLTPILLGTATLRVEKGQRYPLGHSITLHVIFIAMLWLDFVADLWSSTYHMRNHCAYMLW